MALATLPYAACMSAGRSISEHPWCPPHFAPRPGPLVREALGNMHHAFGANDHLPRERLAPGGDACASRPRTCTHTGRLCYWSHRAVVRGLDALAPGPRGTRSTAVTFWEEEPVERSPREGWEEVGWQAELVAALVAAEAGAEEGVSAGASSDSESGSRVGGGVREVGLEGMVGSAGAKGEEEGPSVLAAVEGGHDGERAGAMDEEARLQELLIQAKAAQQQAQRSRLRRPRRLSRRVVLPGGPGGALSDVAVTENYYVLLQPPVHQEVGGWLVPGRVREVGMKPYIVEIFRLITVGTCTKASTAVGELWAGRTASRLHYYTTTAVRYSWRDGRFGCGLVSAGAAVPAGRGVRWQQRAVARRGPRRAARHPAPGVRGGAVSAGCQAVNTRHR